MQYRTLGRTGLTVSEIGVGGAQFGLTNYMGAWDAFSDEAQRATTATIHRALELGYDLLLEKPAVLAQTGVVVAAVDCSAIGLLAGPGRAAGTR